ncbi:PREDICTED: SH3 domain-containing protein 1-like [Tarenaya hassleriana]|uniref:SH3 domain-containing protein 1-like n=1 Tax=Tarenaya hassleriana TaxID=28532 RepID=UPI00053C8B90|nr:PREDICTED: SH3 domain-containing protein 1-like [Tarenaya hassleriana]
MEAIRKQAAKFREQVARQQQAVLKHLGHVNADAVVVDEEELHCHQKLQDLYTSTKAAKRLQRSIVRGLEVFIATSTKLLEIGRKLAEDCKRYGDENQNGNTPLARAALHFGDSYKSMEDERETLLGFLGEQVCEPIRTMVYSAPLEDARHLVHRYDRLRQEVEAQAADVLRRRSKLKDSDISEESYMKLKNAESRLAELKTGMKALGKEATTAMLEVEGQQQKITSQRLLALVEAERTYHRHALGILDKLYSEMVTEEEATESSPQPLSIENVTDAHPEEVTKSNGSRDNHHLQPGNQKDSNFLAKVVHPFDAQSDGELSLGVDDYVIVRKVATNGWSEGECKGKAGWFPSAYVEKQDKAPATKLMEAKPKQ